MYEYLQVITEWYSWRSTKPWRKPSSSCYALCNKFVNSIKYCISVSRKSHHPSAMISFFLFVPKCQVPSFCRQAGRVRQSIRLDREPEQSQTVPPGIYQRTIQRPAEKLQTRGMWLLFLICLFFYSFISFISWTFIGVTFQD